MRCMLCGTEKHKHYDGTQCPAGPDTWSSKQRFASEISGPPQINHPVAFDYENQAWVVDGVYVSCGHPEDMNCGCFGRIHAGESPAANAQIH